MSLVDQKIEEVIQAALIEDLHPRTFAEKLRDALRAFVERKARPQTTSDPVSIYQAIRPTNKYIESFQVYWLHNGEFKRHGYIQDWKEIYNLVNRFFGTNINDSNRGWEDVYVVLQRTEEGAILWSYGAAHRDGGSRKNDHYFFVEAGYDQLLTAMESFRRDIGNLQLFVRIVFDWENIEQVRHPESQSIHHKEQPNLFIEMKRLHLWIDGEVTIIGN